MPATTRYRLGTRKGKTAMRSCHYNVAGIKSLQKVDAKLLKTAKRYPFASSGERACARLTLHLQVAVSDLRRARISCRGRDNIRARKQLAAIAEKLAAQHRAYQKIC